MIILKKNVILLAVALVLMIVMYGCSGGGGSESSSTQDGIAQDWINIGKKQLADGNVTAAKDSFEAALNSCTGDVCDEANFLFGMTRVADIYFHEVSKTYSQPKINGQNVRQVNLFPDLYFDIIKPFGGSYWQPWNIFQDDPDITAFPDVIPEDTALTGGEVQTWMCSSFLPEITGAIDNLGSINANVASVWIDPLNLDQIESDYGDVLVLMSSLESVAAGILVQCSHNVDFNIARAINENANVEDILGEYNDLMSFDNEYHTNLQLAKTYFEHSCDHALNAIDFISSEIDDQEDDLIAFGDISDDELEEAKNRISEYKASLSNPTVITGLMPGMHGNIMIDVTIDLGPFFGANIQMSDFLPQFDGNAVVRGSFPDSSFDGTIGPEINLNDYDF